MSFSHLVAEWHPTKNLPSTISSPLRVVESYWWLGACGHEWEAVLANRKRGSGCPICAGQQVLAGFNDLASQNPTIAAEWHPTKNSLSPSEVNAKSAKKFWWLAVCGHEWQTTLSSRTSKGGGCPICSGRKVLVGFNDLATVNASLAAEWHPTKNGILTAQQVVISSNKKVWWQCFKSHEWEASINNRTWLGNGCPYCGDRKLLSGYNDLATKNPELASEWHPTKNGELTAQQITAANPKKVWWLGKCGHEWQAVLSSRAQGVGCAICAGQKVLAGFNDLATTDPDLAAEWHPTKNGMLTAEQVTRGTNRKVWWSGSCGHEWQAGVKRRTGRGDGCSVCSGHTFVIGLNDLATLYPDIAAQWHPTKNGDLNPSVIGRSYEKKVWWLCSLGHEWEVSPHTRTHGKIWKSNGCFVCKNVSKVEEDIKHFLIGLGLKVESSNRTILGGKEIDLWIPEKNVGIEVNGLYWHREKVKGKNSHYEKWLLSQEGGIKLFQIWEDDWKAHPDIIMRLLAHTLGVSKAKKAPEKMTVTPITSQQAEKFLSEHHLQGYASGSHYLGLVSQEGLEILQAVLVLENETSADNEELNIVRYATQAPAGQGFRQLITHAINAYNPESITAIADHCTADGRVLERTGFVVKEELLPDYMYVIKNRRVSKSKYPLERFQSDPKLLWEEGLMEMELADLNGLDRIWDAGKTHYRLVI